MDKGVLSWVSVAEYKPVVKGWEDRGQEDGKRSGHCSDRYYLFHVACTPRNKC